MMASYAKGLRLAQLSSLSRAGGGLLRAYALVALIGIGAIQLLTQLAPPAVFGEANLLLTFVALALTMVSLPFSNTQLRYHTAAVEAGRGDGFTFQVLAWTLAGAAVAWLLLFAGWVVVADLRLTRLRLAGAVSLGPLLFGTAARNVVFNRVQAERRRPLYATLLVAEAALVTAATALGLTVAATVDGYVVGQACGVAAVAGLALGLTWADSRRLLVPNREGTAFLRQVWSYGAPFAPLAIMGWVNNVADRYTLGALLGPAAVGRYIAPFSLASRGMTLFNGALADLFRPVLFARVNAADPVGATQVFHRWLAARVATVVVCMVGLAAAGPLIVHLLLAPAYRSGAMAILLWIAAGYGVQGICQTLDSRLMSLDRTQALVAPLLVGGISTALFCLALIPRGGPVGAAQATTAGFVLQALVTAWRLRAKAPAVPARSA